MKSLKCCPIVVLTPDVVHVLFKMGTISTFSKH